ncbi:TetR/AcrR family transcriptional regulator [Alloalcanivorax gelatiniphagus]
MLEEALPIFLRNGYERTTVEQLARAAGVTKRTIYSDYGDKAGLFVAMVSRLAADVSDVDPGDEASLSLLATRIVFRTHSEDLVGLHRLVIAEADRFPELGATFNQRADQQHIERLSEMLTRGDRATAHLADDLFSLLLGATHRRRLLGVVEAPSWEQAAEHASRALTLLGLD